MRSRTSAGRIWDGSARAARIRPVQKPACERNTLLPQMGRNCVTNGKYLRALKERHRWWRRPVCARILTRANGRSVLEAFIDSARPLCDTVRRVHGPSSQKRNQRTALERTLEPQLAMSAPMSILWYDETDVGGGRTIAGAVHCPGSSSRTASTPLPKSATVANPPPSSATMGVVDVTLAGRQGL
jgi:hypothetical protein